MRKKLIADMNGVDEQLDELPKEALRLLEEYPDFKPRQLPEGSPDGGGDAG